MRGVNDRESLKVDPNKRTNASLSEKVSAQRLKFIREGNSEDLKLFDNLFSYLVRNSFLQRSTNVSLAISEIRSAIENKTILKPGEFKKVMRRLMDSTGLSKYVLHDLIVEEIVLTSDLDFRRLNFELDEFIETNLDLRSKFEDVGLAMNTIKQLPKLPVRRIMLYLRGLAKEANLNYSFVVKLYLAHLLKMYKIRR